MCTLWLVFVDDTQSLLVLGSLWFTSLSFLDFDVDFDLEKKGTTARLFDACAFSAREVAKCASHDTTFSVVV